MRLHLVDGTYELYRAHYAPRPGHTAPSGKDAKATVGVVASLLALLHESAEAVTHIAVAFDNPIRSFRNDLYAYYKSDEGVPPELREQFERNAYRLMYVVKLRKAIYVLHVFMKKSKSGIGLPKPDAEVIRARLRRAVETDLEN